VLAAQWLNQTGEWSSRIAAAGEPLLHWLGQPSQVRRIRQLVIVVLLLWAVFAVVRIVWALLPQPDSAAQAPPAVINPVNSVTSAAPSGQLDIQRLQALHLFGKAGAGPAPLPEQKVVSAREGIEDNARKTKLSLVLRGIVATTDDGLGHAIIEHRSKQAVYAVEDKLPVPGRVTLAKVMPTQVILNNGGTYERLELFDKSQISSTAVLAPPPEPAAARSIDRRDDAQLAEMAAEYRSRLYKDPQSLASVVNISAVRENGTLRGYRVSPGQDREQFQLLGFQAGDLVTSVNGVSLDNPSNTMKLYNMMRSAGEATFELERGGSPLTLSVSLDGAGQ
jgi:general secretion pathway protein C